MTPDDRSSDGTGDSDGPDRVHRVRWDRYRSPSLGIVETIADTKGVDPLEISPLHGSIEAEALNDLIHVDNAETPTSVSFTHEGILVTVMSDGVLELRFRNPEGEGNFGVTQGE